MKKEAETEQEMGTEMPIGLCINSQKVGGAKSGLAGWLARKWYGFCKASEGKTSTIRKRILIIKREMREKQLCLLIYIIYNKFLLLI